MRTTLRMVVAAPRVDDPPVKIKYFTETVGTSCGDAITWCQHAMAVLEVAAKELLPACARPAR